MVWIITLVVLPFVIILVGVLAFNIYFRKQITRDTVEKPAIDEAYIEAEQTKADDEDLGSLNK